MLYRCKVLRLHANVTRLRVERRLEVLLDQATHGLLLGVRNTAQRHRLGLNRHLGFGWASDTLSSFTSLCQFTGKQLTLWHVRRRRCGRLSRRHLCAGFLSRCGTHTCLAAYREVEDQTGQSTNTCTIGTFFPGPGHDRLVRVIHALGNEVLGDFLGGFSRAFHTATSGGSSHQRLDRAEFFLQNLGQRRDFRCNDVQQAGRCAEQGSRATFCTRSTFGLCGFTGFTRASG